MPFSTAEGSAVRKPSLTLQALPLALHLLVQRFFFSFFFFFHYGRPDSTFEYFSTRTWVLSWYFTYLPRTSLLWCQVDLFNQVNCIKEGCFLSTWYKISCNYIVVFQKVPYMVKNVNGDSHWVKYLFCSVRSKCRVMSIVWYLWYHAPSSGQFYI